MSSTSRASVAKSFSLTRRITSRMPGALATTTIDGKTAFRWTSDDGATWQNWLNQHRRPQRTAARPAGQPRSAAFSLIRTGASTEQRKTASLFDPLVGLRWLTRALF